jgi:hypothetical protein
MRYYILNTKEESDQCRRECYTAYMQNISAGAYKEQTTQWSEEQQRLTDNKYIVPVCPQLGTFGYLIETSTSEWFPEPEILVAP